MVSKKSLGVLALLIAFLGLSLSFARNAPAAASDYWPASYDLELCWLYTGGCSYPTITIYEDGTFDVMDGGMMVDQGTWHANRDNEIFTLLGNNGQCATAWMNRVTSGHYNTFAKGEIYCLGGTNNGADRGYWFVLDSNMPAGAPAFTKMARPPQPLIPDFNVEVCWLWNEPGCGTFFTLDVNPNGTASMSDGSFGIWGYNAANKSATYITTNGSCDEVYVARNMGGGVYDGRVECVEGNVFGGNGHINATVLP
jgi:hypothetical protein